MGHLDDSRPGGTVTFTPANRVSDGTNYKFTIDLDANYAGTLNCTCGERSCSRGE
jgi:hypothetical protein